MRWFRKGAVEVFESMAWMLKGKAFIITTATDLKLPSSVAYFLPSCPTALQFSSIAFWYVLRKPEGIDPSAISLLHFLVGGALVAAGQTLNAGIYRAIGHPGVYYGFKLGHTIPWVTGFPFNVVRHPQYVGSVMSVVGAAVLLWSQAPSGLGLLTAYWTSLYVITGWMESSLHV